MRTFIEHCIRKTQDLSGVWNFAPDYDDVGEKQNWHKSLPTKEKFAVPSVWNNEMGYLNYEGAGWYERKFYTKGGTLRFWFGAVQTQADVWLDGEKLGEHYGGFCEFFFVKTGVTEGWHTLTVRADNRFDEDSIPQKSVDWWHYGGICREVVVETLSGICTLYTKTDYELSADMKTAKVKQLVELYNADDETRTDVVLLRFGELAFEKKITLLPYENKTIEFVFDVDNVQLWGIESPYLYNVVLQTKTDDLIDRTGLRKVEVRHDGIYLNGEHVEIRGVNRHEEHPEWGFAFPLKLMKKDLDIAFQMGCNAIRGSHYPNSRAFMDYCDERGMLFWCEIPIWGVGFSVEAIAREKVIARGLAMHEEMVRHYFNHPSIILWGMHNEIRSDTQEGYTMSELYYKYLKENGGNRIVTYASSLNLKDICFEFCDIVCLNYYLGWYGGETSDWDNFLKQFDEYLKKVGQSHKPVIISEFGAAALYGNHTFDDIRWTEEYQAELISYCLELFHTHPTVCGSYIWQFTDIRSCNELNRARGFNNKGILNEYRKPKKAYYAMKEKFLKWKSEENKNE